MSYRSGANSHFSLWNNQPALGGSSVHDTANDRQTPYSADSQSSRSLSDASPVSDAQAYVRAVKTGETQDRALYHTIERKRPEGKGKANPHSVPSHPGDPGFPEHGLSFAQRLYASALSHKSQPEPSPSNIPVLPPIQYASSSDLPIDGGSQASSEVSQAFNATRGFTSRGATSPEAIAKCPRPPLPMSRVSNYSSMSRSHSAHPSAESAAQLEVRNPRAVSDRSQNVSMEAQHHHRNSVVRNHEASGPRETFVESRSPAIASGTMFLLPPGEQHPETAPSYPPPTFGERPLNPSEGVEADIAQLDIPSLATVSHEDGLPDSLLQPSSEVNQEDVPSYSLVDEQAPPPAFDDLQGTSATGASLVVMSPETLPQEEIWTPPSPPHSPQPVSRSSAAYDSRKAPAYPHLDQSMYSVSTSKTILQDSEASLPSIITKGFGAPLSDSSSTVPTKFQSPSWSPLVSSPSSPLPSDLHSLSISPSHSPDHQSIGTSHHPLSVRKSTISSPPLVNYNTKPISEQSGQRLFIPPALRSGFRPSEDSNLVKKERPYSQSVVNVAGGSHTIDAPTRSMSNMMGAPSLDTRTLTFETLPSNRPVSLGTSPGIQQSNLIMPGSHPSGIRRTIGSLNPEASGPEAHRLIQEAYRRPTHGEAGGKMGYRI